MAAERSTTNGLDGFHGFTLYHDAWERLVFVDGDGQEHVGVEPVRSFPISDGAHSVSICDADGHEIVFLDDFSRLRPDTRQLLEAELALREFVPVIQRILAVEGDGEPCQWHVETDRGPTSFQLDSEDDVRLLDGNQAIIVDAHGVRYLIRDTRRVDTASRRILERFL
jgi:hypothetical protein